MRLSHPRPSTLSEAWSKSIPQKALKLRAIPDLLISLVQSKNRILRIGHVQNLIGQFRFASSKIVIYLGSTNFLTLTVPWENKGPPRLSGPLTLRISFPLFPDPPVPNRLPGITPYRHKAEKGGGQTLEKGAEEGTVWDWLEVDWSF